MRYLDLLFSLVLTIECEITDTHLLSLLFLISQDGFKRDNWSSYRPGSRQDAGTWNELDYFVKRLQERITWSCGECVAGNTPPLKLLVRHDAVIEDNSSTTVHNIQRR
jgi:hypothetical protein